MKCPHCQQDLEQVYACKRGESIAYEGGRTIVRGPNGLIRHEILDAEGMMYCIYHGQKCIEWKPKF